MGDAFGRGSAQASAAPTPASKTRVASRNGGIGEPTYSGVRELLGLFVGVVGVTGLFAGIEG